MDRLVVVARSGCRVSPVWPSVTLGDTAGACVVRVWYACWYQTSRELDGTQSISNERSGGQVVALVAVAAAVVVASAAFVAAEGVAVAVGCFFLRTVWVHRRDRTDRTGKRVRVAVFGAAVLLVSALRVLERRGVPEPVDVGGREPARDAAKWV